MSSYNPRNDLNEIVYLKGRYTNGDANTKKWAEKEAKKYYINLRNNGFGGLAQKYSSLDYAKAYNDYKSNYVYSDGNKKTDTETYISGLKKNANKALDINQEAMADYYKQQKEKTAKYYDDQEKENYYSYMSEKQNLDQELAANGITGGAAESTVSAVANNYLSGKNKLGNEKLRAISDIEAEERAAYYNAQMQKLQNEIDFAREGRTAMENDRQYNLNVGKAAEDSYFSKETLDDNRQQTKFNNDLLLKEMDASKESNEWEKAIKLAQLGDFSGIAKLRGISVDEAYRNYKDLIRFEQSFKSGGLGGVIIGGNNNGGGVVPAPGADGTRTPLNGLSGTPNVWQGDGKNLGFIQF